MRKPGDAEKINAKGFDRTNAAAIVENLAVASKSADRFFAAIIEISPH
ncbi:MAG TPA: hypothetical protein VIL74_02045 [Pyrinomonadaceae bacterium]